MSADIPIRLAVEDDLSEWVLRRALATRPIRYAVGAVYSRRGVGYLKKQALAFNNAAKSCLFLLLADLDRYECPAGLVREWIGSNRHPHFLLRVAVREVESWLLGDGESLTGFLALKKPAVYSRPESIADPKQELLRLASSSPRRALREAMVRREDESGRYFQGPDYNGLLARFVTDSWRIESAQDRCPSLRRLLLALQRIEAER